MHLSILLNQSSYVLPKRVALSTAILSPQLLLTCCPCQSRFDFFDMNLNIPMSNSCNIQFSRAHTSLTFSCYAKLLRVSTHVAYYCAVTAE